MSLTYSLRTSKDLLLKLERDVQILDERVTGDRFFNMVIPAYHIVDWVKRDASVPKDATESMYKNKYLALCRDIANASKHFSLNYENPAADAAESRKGFGCGRFGKGPFGVGEESIRVYCSDGSQISSQELAHGVLDAWRAFFAAHGI